MNENGFPREAGGPGSAGANCSAPITLAETAVAALFDSEFTLAEALIATRYNVLPKRLVEPGPTDAQLRALLGLAAAAPDHGLLTPWRFVMIPWEQRHRLAEVFACALLDRDPDATSGQLQSALEKAHRAPLLLVAIAQLGLREPDIPPLERMVSMGAAIQNFLLGAHAMGFGTGLTSGRAMSSGHLRDLLDLAEGEHAVCCVNVGTVARAKKSARCRPAVEEFFSILGQPTKGPSQ